MADKTTKSAPFSEPFDRAADWLKDAEGAELNDPTAMALATSTPDGFPSVRMVLLKGLDEAGFVFYTNLESRKGTELAANPNAALLFHWKSLRRQIRIEGSVEQVSDDEADTYYNSRPRKSRIGAWASQQSRPMSGRFEFEGEIAKYTAKYAVGDIPRPPYWSGFRLTPKRFEFWQDREFRLHDRTIYSAAEDSWTLETLYP